LSSADLSEEILPGMPVDADDLGDRNYLQWLAYTCNSSALGGPCLLYVEWFMLNWEDEPETCEIVDDDLRRIAEVRRASTTYSKP